MRVALLTYNAQAGDAIGNQVAKKLSFFLNHGALVRVFLESEHRLHPQVRPHAQRLDGIEPAGPAWEFLSSADLMIVEFGQYYPALGLLPLLGQSRPRILFDYHGVTPARLWGGHNREALERGVEQSGLAWCADAVLVHSRFTGQELTAATGLPPERIRVLGHPIDFSEVLLRPRQRLREELGLEQAAILLFVGRLAPNKRVGMLVAALAKLRNQEPAVHAIVIGDASDLYRTELEHCQALAAAAGVSDRFHVLGHVSEDRLHEAYETADVFVMPSVHEGFCIPVVEAMAAGLPVVAARAGALPETVAGAGLTFVPDDAEDLVRQLRRVLGKPGRLPTCPRSNAEDAENAERGRSGDLPYETPPNALRVAVVVFRYGGDFVGGAERSLRTIATALHEAGHGVEVFSTCTTAEGDWANTLAAGTGRVDGLLVHRFRLDDHDREQHHRSVRAILEADCRVEAGVEEEYLIHSIHSSALLERLRSRIKEFDAVITGPYLFGLTYDVARAFPEKTLLVPCFHDEPFARLRVWQSVYPYLGGLLYHSAKEQELAERELGFNHPRSFCLGTLLEPIPASDAQAAWRSIGPGRLYVVYCGRYSRQKNVPTLLEWARRYHAAHPERFTFTFLGQGEVTIPREEWACDLGFVDEEHKRAVLAGAAALVQLSRYESLSLVALEAWAQGTPLIAAADCAVLAAQLERSGGGQTVNGYEAFAVALNDLWEHPDRWRERGAAGRRFVEVEYGSREAFLQRLVAAVRSLDQPLNECMRQRGLERSTEFGRDRWREKFGRLVEEVLEAAPRPVCDQVEVRPRVASRRATRNQDALLVPVRVSNHGTEAVTHEGPGRRVLRCQVVNEDGNNCSVPATATLLPGLLLPGKEVAVAVQVHVPRVTGRFRVGVSLEPAARDHSDATELPPNAWFDLEVAEDSAGNSQTSFDALLAAAQTALAEAQKRQLLPDDYTDVCEGRFAKWKRWLKRKLLGNFKHAYVDVLSRQQSAFNRQLVAALQELAECCMLLDRAQTAVPRDRREEAPPTEASQETKSRLAETQERCLKLEQRVAELERALPISQNLSAGRRH
jgi:glycosyltransferase involved in cell wall biosynthesis